MQETRERFVVSWMKAVEHHDLEQIRAHFAPDMTFHSPVLFKPSQDPEYVRQLFSFLLDVFEEFEYIDRFWKDDGIALVFRARVGELTVEGVDFITLNDEGKAVDFKVMVRPLNSAMYLAEMMKTRFTAVSESA